MHNPSSAPGSRPEVLILSPHPDDAVFSAWHLLTGDPAPLVVTVFSGIPEPGFVTGLDRAHGADDSAAWAQRRRAEDVAVLASAGCRVLHTDLLDLAYRLHAGADLSPSLKQEVDADPTLLLPLARREPALRMRPAQIDQVVGPLVSPWTIVCATAGIGAHPDHEAVADYALSLLPRVAEVRFYADSPYFLRHGLPGALGGRADPSSSEVVDRALDRLGLSDLPWDAVELTDEQMAAKDRAMRGYLTEFAPVDADFGGIASNRQLMRHEVSWVLR